MVRSNWALVAPHFMAIPTPCTISAASGSSRWQPTTRSVAASTTSFITERWSRPERVCLRGRKAER